MTARTRKIFHDEDTRARIQASQIINRLQSHVDGTVELSATQIKAAEILLRKRLPDLATLQISGDPQNPMQIVITTGVPRAGS